MTLRTFAGKIKRELSALRSRAEHRSVYRRFRNYTMVPEGAYIANLAVSSSQRTVPGCVVECGVWRGGMIAGIASVLGPQRDYFLFDSFEGLPDAEAIDGASAIGWQRDKTGPMYFDNCTAEEGWARRAMHEAGVPRFELRKGWFDQALPRFVPPEPIAVLRLDGDWYRSTIVCLESLVPHLHPQGLIILDDYYTWDGCARALHDFLSRTKSAMRVSAPFPSLCVLRNVPASGTDVTGADVSAPAREPSLGGQSLNSTAGETVTVPATTQV